MAEEEGFERHQRIENKELVEFSFRHVRSNRTFRRSVARISHAASHNTCLPRIMIHSRIMPIPLIPVIAGALLGKASSKPEKKIAVNGRVKKDGTRAKAHMRKASKKK
ncbi:MAG TPA: hypothetical protein VEF06_11015 [Bryobacteraceae bacterium]|nr:hypothetical protein [Bryobacteraceae bacterium]